VQAIVFGVFEGLGAGAFGSRICHASLEIGGVFGGGGGGGGRQARRCGGSAGRA